jgi:glycosyltransferase involved in cell wall biosynthesis
MRLLYVTYKVDSHDALVGHVVGWVRALASHLERIEVVCLAAGAATLPDNVRVHSLGKERDGRRLARWARFFQTVWRLREAVDAVFCQFSPQYVLAVAPLAKLRGWPIVLWYTHRHVGWQLRLATLLADCVVTASPESFQLSSSKLQVTGHGIDTEHFKPESAARVSPPVVLAVGRRAPIKNYEFMIDATARLSESLGRSAFRVRIVGGEEGNAPSDYATQLQARIVRAGLEGIVELVGPIAYSQIVREFQRASVHVNLCPTGGMDKAVLEGMACGVPTLVRNQTFAALEMDASGLQLVRDGDVASLSEQLRIAISIPAEERAPLGNDLRRAVERTHGLQQFALRLVEIVRVAA